MAKKSKVSVDDFSFYDEDDQQPLNIIAKNIQKADKEQTTAFELSQTECQALVSRESGVSSALDKPLVSRESGVRKFENSALEINAIVGKEKILVIFICEECRKLGDLETNYIGTENLKNLLSLDSLGLRNLIFRVKEKGFIEVISKQLGRVGLRKFKISRTIYQQFITSALDSRESGVRQPLDKPLDKPLETAPYSSSTNFLNEKTTTIVLPENLARFGISIINLQNLISSGKTTFEVIERSLSALSFDVENGKTGNLANILFGVLGSGREYISQKYSEGLQTELDQELARIIAAEENQKRVAELKLQAKFQEHIQSNPELIDTIREKNKGYISDQGLLKKMAFEEFKENLNAAQSLDLTGSAISACSGHC